MKTPMKIDAYKVYAHKSAKLEEVLKKMEQQGTSDLQAINRTIGDRVVRFEEIKKKSTKDKSYWLIDFGVLTNAGGPGKASETTPIEPFDFEDGEQFGQDTAVLYDPETDCIMIQYNHQGVKANGIRDYLARFDLSSPVSFEFKPILRAQSFEDVMDEKPYVKKIELAIDTRDIDEEDRRSIGGLINEFQEDKDDSYITISISARGGRKSEVPEPSLSLFDKVASIFKRGGGNVKTLRKSVSDGESAQEILDFIEVRLSKRENVTVSEGYRLARDDRWNALIRAYNEWRGNGEIL